MQVVCVCVCVRVSAFYTDLFIIIITERKIVRPSQIFILFRRIKLLAEDLVNLANFIFCFAICVFILV